MIDIFNDEEGWQVWTDTEVSEKDGRCLGTGRTLPEALEEARKELEHDMNQLACLMK